MTQLWEMVNQRLTAMDVKLDKALELQGRVTSIENDHSGMKERVGNLEGKVDYHALAIAKTNGRNDVVMGLLLAIGAPVLVALALAGIAALFHIKIGG